MPFCLCVQSSMPSPVPQGAGGLKFGAGLVVPVLLPSRPARGGWIEITKSRTVRTRTTSRPARGGWIEIADCSQCTAGNLRSRPARGGWIEITSTGNGWKGQKGPVPQGAGGLKSLYAVNIDGISMSRPARGGWIEMP